MSDTEETSLLTTFRDTDETTARIHVIACHAVQPQFAETVHTFGRESFAWLAEGETVEVIVRRVKPAPLPVWTLSAAEERMPEYV